MNSSTANVPGCGQLPATSMQCHSCEPSLVSTPSHMLELAATEHLYCSQPHPAMLFLTAQNALPYYSICCMINTWAITFMYLH